MNYLDELNSIIMFTSASRMLRELKNSGYEVNRSDSLSKLSGNRMTIQRGAPLSEFWHESGHALDMHGSEAGLARSHNLAKMQTDNVTGPAYDKEVRGFENRANATAQQAMRDRGAPETYVKQYRKEVAPYTNTYRAGSDGVVRKPAAPVTPAQASVASTATPHVPPVKGAPLKRGFGVKGLLGAAAVGVAGVGLYAAARKREKEFRAELHDIITFSRYIPENVSKLAKRAHNAQFKRYIPKPGEQKATPEEIKDMLAKFKASVKDKP